MNTQMELPYNNNAEMALIGSVLNDTTILSDLKVLSEDFYTDINKTLYQAIKKLGEKANIITLQEEIGILYDHAYVEQCSILAYQTSEYKHFEDIVISKSILRKQIVLANEIIVKAKSGEDCTDLFRQVDTFNEYDDGELVMIGDIVGDELEHIEKYNQGLIEPGLMTKIKGLDHLLNGLKKGDLIYLGARPSMGKSALAMQIVLNLAEQGKKVGVFSLEMQNAKLVRRMLVNQSRVHLRMIQDKKLGESEIKRLTNAASKLFQQNIALSDKAGQKATDILRKAKRHQKLHGMDVLVIDHFHLLKPSIKGSNYETRSFDSQLLKEIAKELNIPVICLCQLNRGLESRAISDRMPILSDLKETGSLEQDGDVIIFINREDYWHKNEPDYTPTHRAEVSVAKNRDGEIGNFEMEWRGGTQQFINL